MPTKAPNLFMRTLFPLRKTKHARPPSEKRFFPDRVSGEVFMIRHGDSFIEGFFVSVKKPKAFGGEFRAGEKVLKIGIHSMNPQEFKAVLAETRLLVESLKKAGFAGFYGDSYFPHIIERARRIFTNARVIRPPLRSVIIEKVSALTTPVFEGYPAKGIRSPVQRIVCRF